MTEVLIVCAVISVLAGLLLPAVQYSRSIALRIQCSNRVRQISLAFQNYESAFGVFPNRNWCLQVQGFLEGPASGTRFPGLTCPADQEHADGELTKGHLSYAISEGIPSLSLLDHGIVSRRRRWTRSTEIFDGLSNTAAIGERLSFPWYAPQVVDWNQVRRDWIRTHRLLSPAPATRSEFESACRFNPGWPLGSWRLTQTYDHLIPPNGNSCYVEFDAGFTPPEGVEWIPHVATTAGSPHAGGTHLGFCDGSVRFVSDQIAVAIWQATGTRGGREIETLSSF